MNSEFQSGSTGYLSGYTYNGVDQVISNYNGQPITLNITENFSPGVSLNGDNFILKLPTGTLTVQNVTDKVVDFRDYSGNEIIKAYTPSTEGTIDGRGINAVEVIFGAANGSDVIFAGDGGSALWGGDGSFSDVLVGGGGRNFFYGGRYEGSDVFYNVSSSDVVNLTDATLSDIIAAVEVNGNIAIGFNTGNIITIQSTELLSAAVNLADGSSWRFNHVTKSWQGA